jgi:hypothetical protein
LIYFMAALLGFSYESAFPPDCLDARLSFSYRRGEAETIHLRDEAAARVAARETFGEMIREGSVGPASRMEVVDASGRRILLLTFTAE